MMKEEPVQTSIPGQWVPQGQHVHIPFMFEFQEAMLSGRKTMTSRTRKMAQPGCYFIAFGQDFRVDFVDKMRLYDVAYGFYDKEGVDSPEAFIELWKKIHPRKGFDPDWPVWAIQFHKFTIKPDEPREKP